MLIVFCVVFNFFVQTEASVPDISINVSAMPYIANNYGGVDIDVSLSNINNTNYIYEIKRSEDAFEWQNIGLAFDYSYSMNKIIPHTLKVLNVYPDNESFTMPVNLQKKYSKELIATLKNIYSVPYGTFKYKDGTTAQKPRSSMMKIWMEGGTYSDGKQTINYPDISKYNGNKLFEIEQMSMKEFNQKIKDVGQLENYDILFFGTWDANAWNDLNETSYMAVRKFIENGHGAIFGHDTIAYELTSEGKFTNQCEADNFFRLAYYAGLNTIPGIYEDASLIKSNSNGYKLPLKYQLWGGKNADNTVTVRFSKAKNAADSSLTTFPNNLLGKDGKVRELKVPITHTAWMGLCDENNNVVSFVKNEYEVLPQFVKDKYNSEPEYRYNWYLCSGRNVYSCYAIQTGHMRNESSDDERKLISNVICSAYKKEKIKTSGNYNKSKIDTSAQDYNPPEVLDVEYVNADSDNKLIRFKGNDYGTDYYYYAKIKSLDTGQTAQTDISRITVTTGIKSYFYIADSDKNNRDFDVDKAVEITLEKNDKGFTISEINAGNIYLHVKAIDYAGNVSEPIVIDLSEKTAYCLEPLSIKSVNEKYLYKSTDKKGIRHYYVNGNYDFNITGGCFVYPFASLNVQPYCNKLNGLTISTPVDAKIGENKSVSYYAGIVDELISVKSVVQNRKEKSSVLLFDTSLCFKGESNNKEIELKPGGIFYNNKQNERISPEDRHKLIVTCDQNSPRINISNVNSWYNKYNYNEAFVVEFSQYDDCSGIKMGNITLKKYDTFNWKTVGLKTCNKDSQKISFLNLADEGIYKYEIISEDNVGNVSKSVKMFSVDKTAPVVSGLQSDYGWTNQNVEIKISAEDNMSGVAKIILYDEKNNIIKQSLGSKLEYEFCDEQQSSYYIIAEDNAGNLSQKYIFNVKIDKTKPEISGENLTNEVLYLIDKKETYYITDNNINVCATDNNDKGVCSGIYSCSLKNQNNQEIRKNVSKDDLKILCLEYNVTDYKESDFYCISAVDKAGNIRKIYIVPECCQKNRIRRYIDHDNYEQQYGYFRLYE